MVASAHETATGPIEVLAYVDLDDLYLTEYEQLDGVRLVTGPRIVLSECWNQLAQVAQGDILGMASDDIRYRTPGWDQKVRDAFDRYPDRIAFVYGRDGFADRRMGTHGFLSREWVNTVGYFTWGEFPADYADTWLNEIANMIGRRVYIPSILTEHLHPLAKKAEWDQTHKERLARSDRGRLYRALRGQRIEDAQKLREACL
jgi:hypothetical protein